MSDNHSFFHILAKIQQLQDMFSHHFGVAITIHSFHDNGSYTTIPSNQNVFCYNKQTNCDSLCTNFITRMEEQLTDDLIVTICPYQFSFAIAPLSISLDSCDNSNTSYYITIIQEKNEEILTAFQDSLWNGDTASAEFYDIAQLITSAFHVIFALIQTDEPVSEPPGQSSSKNLDKLTDREREILRLVSTGMSNQEIAAHLFISEHTVKAHLSNILKKLNLHNRTQLAIYNYIVRK